MPQSISSVVFLYALNTCSIQWNSSVLQQTWFHAGGWVDGCVQFVRVYGRGGRTGGMRRKKHKVCEGVSEKVIENVGVWVCACGWGCGQGVNERAWASECRSGRLSERAVERSMKARFWLTSIDSKTERDREQAVARCASLRVAWRTLKRHARLLLWNAMLQKMVSIWRALKWAQAYVTQS